VQRQGIADGLGQVGVGVAPQQHLVGWPALHFCGAVAKHAGESLVHIADASMGISDQDGTVAGVERTNHHALIQGLGQRRRGRQVGLSVLL
jgi:hypothetical protein